MLTAITRDVLLENVRRWRGGGESADDQAGNLAAIIAGVRRVRDGIDGIAGVPFKWQWWRTPFQINTVGARRFTVSTAIVDGAGTTAVVSSSPTNFTTDAYAGFFLEFEAEPGVFREIASNTATTFTLHSAYGGPGVAVSDTALVHKLAYALPDNFDGLLSIRGVTANSRADFDEVATPSMLLRMAGMRQSGVPCLYSIAHFQRDTAAAALRQARLFLYPPPQGPAVGAADDDAESCVYEVEYWRTPGWRDASTGVWKLTPTAASDTVDFYPERLELLEAAIKCCLRDEFPGIDLGPADWDARFASLLAPAMRGDTSGAGIIRGGRYGGSGGGRTFPPSFDNYPSGLVLPQT